MNTNTLRAKFLASDLVQSSGGGGAGMLYLRPSLLLLLILSVLIFSCDPDEPEKKPPTTQDKDKGGNDNQPVTPPEQPTPEPTAPIASLGAISDNAKKDANNTGWVSQGQPITFTATAKDTEDKEITNAQFIWQWRKRGQDLDRGFGKNWTEITGQTTATATLTIPADERVGAYELRISATSGGKSVNNHKETPYKFTVRKSGCPAPDSQNAATNSTLQRMITSSNPSDDLNAIDTSLVTNMYGIFLSNKSFDREINCWDVSNVNLMASMFAGASSFNKNIGDWDVSNVNSMSLMFATASAFNNGDDASIGNWDTSQVTNMDNLFLVASAFNQDLSGWNVANVTTHTSYDTAATNWEKRHKPPKFKP